MVCCRWFEESALHLFRLERDAAILVGIEQGGVAMRAAGERAQNAGDDAAATSVCDGGEQFAWGQLSVDVNHKHVV